MKLARLLRNASLALLPTFGREFLGATVAFAAVDLGLEPGLDTLDDVIHCRDSVVG